MVGVSELETVVIIKVSPFTLSTSLLLSFFFCSFCPLCYLPDLPQRIAGHKGRIKWGKRKRRNGG